MRAFDRLELTAYLSFTVPDLAELGRYSGYDQWKASEEQLFSEWVLESEIFFDDGFRLIFAGHPIYYLDLLLEFDSGFSPTHVQFDG